MKVEINERLLRAIEQGSDRIRANVRAVRKELEKKPELTKLLASQLEGDLQDADMLEGFVKRTRTVMKEEEHA